ncbi:uncharacterized protein LOC131007072 [Salvia miltiorrhiza]|uniref:uncharacterized protein LOC131007072 n=1 Tax=Salvia miltiorrhiza TaxID=226208 RepID=UPI0025ACB712|nr:uncharacterized protein LOC131007072 [Salvia miltiorrhiza]
MGDSQPQDSKKRAVYEAWTKEQSDALLDILVESAHRGWRDNSGLFSKATVEERILPVLNEKLRCNKNYNHYQSRIKWFKSRWNAYSTLLKFNSGFGYDNTTKKFTAPDEVWDAYIEAHPKDAYLRTGSFSNFEDLGLAVGNGVAIGRNAIGVGSATDARTIGVDESRGPLIEELNYDADNEAFVVLGQNDPPLSGSKSPLESTEVPVESTQRRAPAKRSRGQFETNLGHSENSSHQELMIIREKAHVDDTRYTTVEEMLATFLIIVGYNDRYCNVRERFGRSHFAASQNFNKILRALNIIAPDMMVKPTGAIPAKIRESTRFYPYFKDCIGAIDGTHIPAMIRGKDVSCYRNRHGVNSQNVLAACNFDLQFIYVLSGWEGSTHDSKILSDALSRPNGLHVPQAFDIISKISVVTVIIQEMQMSCSIFDMHHCEM